jgi:putative ABC transport system permease protein
MKTSRARNVCIVGQTVRTQLFGLDNPVGQIIHVAGQPFEVVGLLASRGQSATGQDQDDTIFVPYTTAQVKLRGNKLAWLDDILLSARSADVVNQAADEIAVLLRERHRIGPDDEDDFNIRHPEEVIKAQLETSRTFSTLLISIASVALLAGGIGIMGSSMIGRFLGWSLSIPLQAVGFAVGFSVVVGVVFGFLPARRAARLDPIEALRSD